MEYVIDMQGFKQMGDDYILKELAFVAVSEDSDPVVILFKEPFSWRKLTPKYQEENIWLVRNHHGISWRSPAGLKYTEIGNVLRETLRDATKVYVRGQLRKKWLERFKFPVADISEYEYPPKNLPKCTTVCENHNGAYKSACALHNVKIMKSFLLSR